MKRNSDIINNPRAELRKNYREGKKLKHFFRFETYDDEWRTYFERLKARIFSSQIISEKKWELQVKNIIDRRNKIWFRVGIGNIRNLVGIPAPTAYWRGQRWGATPSLERGKRLAGRGGDASAQAIDAQQGCEANQLIRALPPHYWHSYLKKSWGVVIMLADTPSSTL